MRELINFTLNAPQGTGEHTIVFKQPLLIKPDSTITVNSVVVNWTPLTGYKDDTFCILTDLPIKTFHAKGFNGQAGGAVEDRVFAFVPPNQPDQSDVDDPATGVPALAVRSYEPVQPIVHTMLNNEFSINSINFKVVDGFSLAPRTDIDQFTVTFTLSHEC